MGSEHCRQNASWAQRVEEPEAHPFLNRYHTKKEKWWNYWKKRIHGKGELTIESFLINTMGSPLSVLPIRRLTHLSVLWKYGESVRIVNHESGVPVKVQVRTGPLCIYRCHTIGATSYMKRTKWAMCPDSAPAAMTKRPAWMGKTSPSGRWTWASITRLFKRWASSMSSSSSWTKTTTDT